MCIAVIVYTARKTYVVCESAMWRNIDMFMSSFCCSVISNSIFKSTKKP